MDDFSIDDREVKAYVRQSQVSPCVHVNPGQPPLSAI